MTPATPPPTEPPPTEPPSAGSAVSLDPSIAAELASVLARGGPLAELLRASAAILARHTPFVVIRIARPSLAPTLRDAPRRGGVHVMVVDDDDDARELLVRVLEELSATVTPVSSVAEALGLAADRGGRLPVIALTAYASPEERSRALAEGFGRHVAKPVQPGELAMLVAEVAGRASPRPRASA